MELADHSARATRRKLKYALARLGIEVSRRPRDLHPALTQFDERRRKLLRSQRITLVIDVGANSGQYARRLRRAGYEGHIVSLEPLSSAFAELAAAATTDVDWDVVHTAAGAKAGTATIHVSGNSWSSSLLAMEDRHRAAAPDSAYIGDETIRIEVLDDIVAPLRRTGACVLLKVDVQGFELDVMDGARVTLEATSLVEVEVSLVPLYAGAPSHLSVLGRIADSGFDIVAVEEEFVEPGTGRALQLNVIAARR